MQRDDLLLDSVPEAKAANEDVLGLPQPANVHVRQEAKRQEEMRIAKRIIKNDLVRIV